MYEDADALVLKGSDYIYNVQFDSARATFEELIRLYPKHPSGYFLDAMIDWWRITIHRNNQAFEDEFLKNINKVLKVCDKLLKENPKDLTALFFKGGALGYRGRYYAINENWFDAASDGKEAFDIMQTCYKEAPGNHDIMLGSGIYNYFAAVFPEQYPMAKPLLTFLPPADKKIGLYQLKAAALNSRYSKVEAMVVLLQAYYSFEKDYKLAYYWSEILFRKYPNNPYFHRYYARCLNKMGNWDSLEVEWREIVKRSIARMEGYNNLTALEGLYYVGLSLQRKGKHNDAIKYFLKTIEVADYIEDFESGYKLSALYKLAYSYERTNDIKNAKLYYNKCLEYKDYNDSHENAKARLKNLK
jgi:tetratricopeptide (TPR) repeat protein